MTELVRFPHTPHLVWLGRGKPRGDKVLDADDVRAMLSGDVVVEEKVDGANLGLSVGSGGILVAQHRGAHLDLGDLHGQWKPLRRRLALRTETLVHGLGPDRILFGEWCYAVHSIRYTRLPDWFLAFDVYDRVRGAFWSVARRNELAARLGLAIVPQIAHGRFDVEGLKRLLGSSRFTDGPAEGLYIRREEGGWLVARAKLVRAEFVDGIDEHWSRRRLESNRVGCGSPVRGTAG
ncbi:MAG: RNA ligase family protein [Myxococcales bacterium]|nr:RNA ligase family protein [Myxococcales bacterium]